MELRGLGRKEARSLLEKWGPNEPAPARMRNLWGELRTILLDPMGLMLLGLALLYSLLGEKTDALIVGLAFIPIVAVDVLLDLRATRALSALRATLTPLAKVLREGEIIEIPIREVVPGDLLIFEEGQTLPADGEVVQAEQLFVTEAALTGESEPVSKSGGERFFGGTTVLGGRGIGSVSHTGARTKLGGIALLLSEMEETRSPLKRKIDKLVKRVLVLALLASVLLFVLEFLRHGQVLPSLVLALTLGMAAVPEEFPLVFTLYLSVGAWRLSRLGVLVKSLPSVETLGGVDVICTDKTGTLTEGIFQLTGVIPHGARQAAELGLPALLACEPHPVDAMEVAIYEKLNSRAPEAGGWSLVHDFPFETKGKHMSHVWRDVSGQEQIAMKGAVEGVLEHCLLTAEVRTEVEKRTNEFAAQGKRVLGLAGRSGRFTGERELDERDLDFLGFLVFSDPIRESVRAAISQCQGAGIEVKMLTGDHLLTAHAIADEAGIAHGHDFLFTGRDLARMSEEERHRAYLEGAIFARLEPEQKHELVKTLKSAGKVVAMTGDGINDAPALKLADIGISMGRNATDVARSAARMVLMKNDFSGIVDAVFEGRRIFANLRRSFSYLVAFHTPVVILAMIPSFLGWPPLLLPVHIILLELIVHPVSAFTFENAECGKVASTRVLISGKKFLSSLVSGLCVSGWALFLFAWMKDASLGQARAGALGAILIGNVFFVLIESVGVLTRRTSSTVAGLLGLAGLVAGTGWAGSFLHLDPVSPEILLLAGLGGLSAYLLARVLARFDIR